MNNLTAVIQQQRNEWTQRNSCRSTTTRDSHREERVSNCSSFWLSSETLRFSFLVLECCTSTIFLLSCMSVIIIFIFFSRVMMMITILILQSFPVLPVLVSCILSILPIISLPWFFSLLSPYSFFFLKSVRLKAVVLRLLSLLTSLLPFSCLLTLRFIFTDSLFCFLLAVFLPSLDLLRCISVLIFLKKELCWSCHWNCKRRYDFSSPLEWFRRREGFKRKSLPKKRHGVLTWLICSWEGREGREEGRGEERKRSSSILLSRRM